MRKPPNAGDTESLTKREREIVRLFANGKSRKEIARELGVSTKTIDAHRSNILNKVRPRKSVQASAEGVSDGPDEE